jgi:DNA-binding winged helix-turn-helix (wHTH) protein/tetratricopeptide (TPR) repeat protein
MSGVRYRFGDFLLDATARELHRGDAVLPLPRRVFDCVLYLVEQRERAVGRDELAAALWSRVDIADTQLSQLMRRVRRVLGDDGQAQGAIRTVPGFGYRWVMPVEAQAEPVAHASEPGDGVAHAAIHEAARPSWRRRAAWMGGAGILALAIVGGAALVGASLGGAGVRPDGVPAHPSPLAAPASLPDDPSAMAVLPLAVDAPRGAGWVRLGAMDVVAERLRGAGLHVPSSENVLAAMQATGGHFDGRDSGGGTPGAALEKLGSVLGTAALVRGSATRSAGAWHVELHTESAGSLTRHAAADRDDPLDAARAAADLLLAAMGHAASADAAQESGADDTIARARAAMLAGELDTARSILAAASEAGGRTPLLRYWQARLEFMGGKLDRAESAYTALLEEARAANDIALQGRVLIGRAGVNIRRGEYARAEADFDAAATVLRATDENPQYGEALAGRGIARTALHRFPEALADLGAARAQLERLGDRFDVARVDANLGLVEMVRERPEQALPYLQSAIARFESFGAVSQILSCLNAVFDAQAWLLDWNDAYATIQRRIELGPRSADPMQRILIGVDKSRVLMALGRYREAEAALAAIEAAYPEVSGQAAGPLYAQRAELEWRKHRAASTLAAARKALAVWPDLRDDDLRARIALTWQRALIASGAAGAAAVAPALAVTHDTAPERKPSLLLTVAAAEWADHLGRTREAEQAFRDALAAAEAQGLPKHVALASEAYGSWLLRQHRLDDASAVIGRIAPWAERDFDCALLKLALLHAWGDAPAWKNALDGVRRLAGEREIPRELRAAPL